MSEFFVQLGTVRTISESRSKVESKLQVLGEDINALHKTISSMTLTKYVDSDFDNAEKRIIKHRTDSLAMKKAFLEVNAYYQNAEKNILACIKGIDLQHGDSVISAANGDIFVLPAYATSVFSDYNYILTLINEIKGFDIFLYGIREYKEIVASWFNSMISGEEYTDVFIKEFGKDDLERYSGQIE